MFRSFINYQQLSNEELVQRCGRGEKKAFDQMYSRLSQPLFAYFYRMLWQDKDLAEDMTQELFIRLFQHAAAFDTSRSAKTWIYSIAHNLCKNQYRKAENVKRYIRQEKNAEEQAPEVNQDLKNFEGSVHELVDQWPEEKKHLFVLRFREQLTIPEIAEILQIAEGTVKSRLYHLQQELRSQLKHYKNII